jgi:hypothetical protein
MPDKIAQIRTLYFAARPATIEADLARAVAVLKSIESETERERASVYMEGLNEMRAQWRKKQSR